MKPTLCALALIVASHCGNAIADPNDPPNAGERSGVIVAIERAPDFDEDDDVACKRFASRDAAGEGTGERAGEGAENRRYAVVRFFSGRHAHRRVLPLASGFPAQVGDRVVFRTDGCAEIGAR